MTDTRTIEAQREEVNLDDLHTLPFKGPAHRYGSYLVNAGPDDFDRVEEEISKAGPDYRAFVYATREDGNRYPVFVNEGRGNGIGADGLAEMIEVSSLPDLIQEKSHGIVKADEIAFVQVQFVIEQHRG
jgi:hypothetical protein